MARTEVGVTTLSGNNTTGVTPPAETASDFVNGNVLSNLHNAMWLEVTNTHATLARDIRFITPGAVGGRAIADDTINIPALAKRRFGPFDQAAYGTSLQIDVLVDNSISLRGYQCVPGY